ncbi:hypothetical protein LPB67_15660 [Undibacterium sp. Jales W-56]|uniref:hypothetical protein n=1 Tax=Undibacterium sp. Jales W-56 TaxID=2897325 RepID=UPI0021D137BF|nr:hypothetical protein [Undibacterium sp. Jales W-56]MCU6435213.1 hypothetical protein [Undibacterium sp. Jales W-56]
MLITQYPRQENGTEVRFDILRQDRITEGIVNKGISIQSTFGTLCALEYLQAEGVSPIVSKRVLSDANQRRM